MKGTLFDIKEMAVHDGPGLRTTVFLKGCPLRCSWCHNPEGLLSTPQVLFKEARCVGCGQCRVHCDHPECKPLGRCIYRCPENCLEPTGWEVEAAELAEELSLQAEILSASFGGFTFSGGEPLYQPDFLLELMDALKPYSLCIETSGYASSAVFEAALARLDYVIMDIKLADAAEHKKYTLQDNTLILENLRRLQKSGKPHLIRTPLVPGITDTPENLAAIKNLIGQSPWEQLPYNGAAGAKYKMLGIPFDPYKTGKER